MKNRTREKIALVVFAFLLVFGGALLISYFATGLTWTQAATFVDDTVGRMDGYTAFVYSGVIDPLEVTDQAEGDMQAGTSGKAPSETPPAISGEVSKGDEASPVEADSMGLRIVSYFPLLDPGGYVGVFPSEVRELYESKGAKVGTLDISDMKAYEKPTVINVGDKRIGVYSLTSYLAKPLLKKNIDYFNKEKVDAVVCIAPSVAMLSDLEGTDVVILTRPSENYSTGSRVGNTLIAESPEIGGVGVVFFSPNNVASARSIDVL